MGRSGVATHNFFPKAYQYWDDLNYIAENNEDWRMKITNIELTNDASPLTFDIIIIQNLWGFIDLKYPGNSSNDA